MTVGELIEKLRAYPEDMRVVVDGYEGGYSDPIVAIGGVVFNDSPSRNSEWWYGQHGEGRLGQNEGCVEAVLIQRL